VVDFILQQPEGTSLILASPLPFYGQKDLTQIVRLLMQQGITRLICGEKGMLVEELARRHAQAAAFLHPYGIDPVCCRARRWML
jgi:hypothetical protein